MPAEKGGSTKYWLREAAFLEHFGKQCIILFTAQRCTLSWVCYIKFQYTECTSPKYIIKINVIFIIYLIFFHHQPTDIRLNLCRGYSAGQLCLSCAAGCASCEKNATHCLTCDEPLLLHDHQCVEECPPSRIVQGKECRRCPPACQDCDPLGQCTGMETWLIFEHEHDDNL